MQKTLILVAGPPATGKSYFINEIRKTIHDFFLISPDEIKELYADKFGFNNATEKSLLEVSVWKFYYHIIRKYMWVGKGVIITEYPFSEKQKTKFIELTSKFNYQIITIRLICDFDVLWQRRKERDLGSERHLSHVVTSYHEGDVLQDRSHADGLVTKEQFEQKIIKSEYNQFSMGTLFEIDVTDYTKLNYAALIDEVYKLINR